MDKAYGARIGQVLMATRGDGIVSKGVENTIRNVSHLASEGMRNTDSEIIRIMLEKL